MHKPEPEGEIVVVLRHDPGHAVGVPLDPDLGLRPCQHDAAIGLRQCRTKEQVEASAEDDQQPTKQAYPLPDPPPPAGRGPGKVQRQPLKVCRVSLAATVPLPSPPAGRPSAQGREWKGEPTRT